MKLKVVISFVLFSWTSSIFSIEEITLDQCRSWGEFSSPLTSQKELLEEGTRWAVSAINTGFLPQMQIQGTVSYQSDNFAYRSEDPLMYIPMRAQDQYKAEVGFSQIIYDGGGLSSSKRIRQVTSDIDRQRLEIQVQSLKSKINDVYLNILLLDEQLRVVDLQQQELENQKGRLDALLQNGLILRSEVDIMDTELLMVKQKRLEIIYNRKTLVKMLSEMTSQPLTDNVQLKYPEFKLFPQDSVFNRPELDLFDLEVHQMDELKALAQSRALPNLNLYAVGGYGRPTFNLLNNNFDWYYLAGLKLNIPLTGWIAATREKKGLDVAKKILLKRKEEFEKDLTIQISEQQSLIDKFSSLIQTDYDIIEKRIKIKERTAAKLENGAATSTDYITDLNAESQVRMSQKLHQIQLVQAQINYSALRGYY